MQVDEETANEITEYLENLKASNPQEFEKLVQALNQSQSQKEAKNLTTQDVLKHLQQENSEGETFRPKNV